MLTYCNVKLLPSAIKVLSPSSLPPAMMQLLNSRLLRPIKATMLSLTIKTRLLRWTISLKISSLPTNLPPWIRVPRPKTKELIRLQWTCLLQFLNWRRSSRTLTKISMSSTRNTQSLSLRSVNSSSSSCNFSGWRRISLCDVRTM